MAIDFQTIKSMIFGDKPAANGSAQTEGDADFDFADFMRKQGSRVGSGLNDSSDRAGITAIGETSDNMASDNNHSYDSNDDVADRGERYSDDRGDSGHDSNDDSTAQSTQQDDFGDRQGSESAEANDGGEQNADSDPHTEAHGDDGASDDDASSMADAGDDGDTIEEDHGDETTEQANDENTGDGETSAAGDGEDTQAKDATTSNDATSSTANAEQTLHTLLTGAQESGVSGQAADKTTHQGENTSSRENATSGLNTAINSVGKQKGSTDGQAGQSGNNGQAAQGNAKAQAQNVNNGNANAATNANANATSNANANAAIGDKAQATTTGNGNAAQQAAQLSKTVGDGNKVAITVEVTDESKKLVSKPSSSLTSSAAATNDGSTKSLRAQQAPTATGTAGQTAGAETQTNAGAAGQTAQQAAQQAASNQNQAANTALSATKGVAQGPTHGAAAPTAGGAENTAATAPNTQTQAQQAQHNTSPQAANAPRFTLPSQAILDQVSVQISKALNAGNDKINIQLRPADLGRVDVQMELATDGRVSAVVTADNKNTLDLLQRDSKQLQEALQQAGLQMDHDSLSFNLREQNPQGGENGNGGASGSNGDMADGGLADEDALAGMPRDIISDTRIDVRV